MIPHWALAFLSDDRFWSAVIVLVLPVAAFALIPFNDWFVIYKEARKGWSVKNLEALFALEDPRGGTPSRVRR